MTYKEWKPGMPSPFEGNQPTDAEVNAAVQSVEHGNKLVPLKKGENPLAEPTDAELAAAAEVLEHGKKLVEVRDDKQRILDTESVEDIKGEIDSLGNPLEKFREEEEEAAKRDGKTNNG